MKVITPKELDKGNLSIITDIKEGKEMHITIEVNKSFVPKNLDMNNDGRELGIFIKQIEIIQI